MATGKTLRKSGTSGKKKGSPRKKRTVSREKGVKKMKTTAVQSYKKRKTIQSINPFTEEVMKEFPLMTAPELNRQVHESREAFLAWRDVPVAERANYAKKLAAVLRAEKRVYAELITKEMARPSRSRLPRSRSAPGLRITMPTTQNSS
jgi:acyl-CoA reductase-like NAD-dependent aldehyde dehydrogenase